MKKKHKQKKTKIGWLFMIIIGAILIFLIIAFFPPSKPPNGPPPECEPHTSYDCYQGDIYWFDSCGKLEGIKEHCSVGCANNVCTTCIPQNSYRCYNNDIYWFDSCDRLGTIKEYCNYGCEGQRCKVHSLKIISMSFSACKEGACGDYAIIGKDFESIINYANVGITNSGDFSETFTISCNDNTQTESISKGQGKTFLMEWNPIGLGIQSVSCNISNSFVSDSKTQSTTVNETLWHEYFRVLPFAYIPAIYSRATENCDKDAYVVKQKSDELTKSNPEATIQSYLDWIYTNITYDKDMYNNIIVNGLEYLYGTPKASTTMLQGRGICRHQAQVFVSFARARGMPARIVWVWSEGCKIGDFTCYGANFLHFFGLAPYNHSIAQVWLYDHWEYVEVTSGGIIGENLPYYFSNPQILTSGIWGC